MPIVAVESVDEARAFYVDKLGFDHQMGVLGDDGKLDFCTVSLAGGRVMFTRSSGPIQGKPTAEFYIQVPDVQEYYEQLVAREVRGSAPEDMWWGDRVFIIEDLNGYRLWFYQSVREPQPPTGTKIV
jgi:uncharacterized glyoxalase superfamily protein PhnB